MAQSYTSNNKSYPAGSHIIVQGENKRTIIKLLHGTVAMCYCDDSTAENETEIIDRAVRVNLFNTEGFFGLSNLVSDSVQPFSYIALTDCDVLEIAIPDTAAEVVQFLRSNASLAYKVMTTIKEGLDKSFANMKKYARLLGDMNKVIDNLNLIFAHATKKSTPELKKFLENGGSFEGGVGSSFLLEDNSVALETSYNMMRFNPSEKYDLTKLEFLGNLIKTNAQAFMTLCINNPKIYTYIYNELVNFYDDVGKETAYLSKSLDQIFVSFFDDNNSAFNRAVENVEKFQKLGGPALTNAIVSLCKNIEKNYTLMTGNDHVSPTDKYNKLAKAMVKMEGTQEAEQTAATSNGAFKKKLKGSTQKILAYSGLPKDRQTAITKTVKDITKINFQDPTSKDSRLIIRRLQEDFFELYKSIILKIFEKNIAVDSLPLEVALFLYFGFLDESLLTEEQAEFLCSSVGFLFKRYAGKIKVIHLVDYLRLIYEGTEAPSMTETGELFSKIVKKVFTKNEKVVEDTPAGKVGFEIDNMIRSAMRITSDNLRAYVPVLTENSFKGIPSRLFMQPKRLEQYIEKINKLDYTLFFRETTWKSGSKCELIKKEVTPYLILVPNSGIRVQMWQEMINNSRASRGRFVVPLIFNDDIEKSLIKACAHFRWEINKVIAGANWMDPTEGGLVGAYYDYTQYYEKTYKELSSEAKELIKEQFKRIKIDRDRFAFDYSLWLTNESKGVPKLNKVVRSMFYKHIPFPNQVREYLRKMPLFTEMDTKFTNIRNRDYKSFESRYHKYLQDGKLPPELQAYLDMMKS